MSDWEVSMNYLPEGYPADERQKRFSKKIKR